MMNLRVPMAVCVLMLGAVGPAMAQNCRWTNLFPYPLRRAAESMAYDSARRVCVLFGGKVSGGAARGDTWEWDGLEWVHRSVGGPPPRASHKMVFDSVRNVVVLFGGNDDREVPFGDTWEWDGDQWTQRASSGPSPRVYHAMAYDAARGVTVVYGGIRNRGAAPNDETWVWDGTMWTRVAQTGPMLKEGAEMVFDSVRGVVVLHGCPTDLSSEAQTWEWDGQSWTLIGTTGPVVCIPFSKFEMVYDSTRSVTVAKASRDVWEYDGNTWVLRSTGGPVGSAATFGFAFDSRRGVSVLIDPLQSKVPAEWDGSTWSHAGKPRPSGMEEPAVVYDTARGVSVLVGSFRGFGTTRTWEWDGIGWAHRQITGPPPRQGHAMAYDSARHVTTLFGGEIGSTFFDDTWEFDGQAWSLVSTAGPSPRSFAAMSYDAARGVTVLTGGRTSAFRSNKEVWEWDGRTWTQRPDYPNGYAKHAMAFDRARNVTVLAGGALPSGRLVTWEYDGQTWTIGSNQRIRPTGSMVFDEGRGACVYVTFDSVWIWDGVTWSRGPASPRLVGQPKAAYDIARDAMVLMLSEAWNPDPWASTVWEYGCACYADCDQSGTLDMLDFLCFQTQFVRGDPEACNCDTSTGSNVCDIFDFLCFQSAFVGGCS